MLGINNTFRDAAIRAGESTTDAHLIAGAQPADDALHDWARKYPNDPQLARSFYLAFQFYRRVWTKDAQAEAWHALNIVAQRWPSSYFGKLVRKNLDIGFTAH